VSRGQANDQMPEMIYAVMLVGLFLLSFFPPPKGYRTLAEEVVYAIMFLFDVLVCLDYNKTK
jgi:hypothetical protein